MKHTLRRLRLTHATNSTIISISAVEVHHVFAEAPDLSSSIPQTKTELGENKSAIYVSDETPMTYIGIQRKLLRNKKRNFDDFRIRSTLILDIFQPKSAMLIVLIAANSGSNTFIVARFADANTTTYFARLATACAQVMGSMSSHSSEREGASRSSTGGPHLGFRGIKAISRLLRANARDYKLQCAYIARDPAGDASHVFHRHVCQMQRLGVSQNQTEGCLSKWDTINQAAIQAAPG